MVTYRFVATSLIIVFSLIVRNAQGQYQHLERQLRNHAIGLDSTSLAAGSPFDLHNVIDSNFNVLAIGEQSHGTSEFFKARISLIKSLTNAGMLTKIGLEAPISEVEKLNSYISEGQGNIKHILASFRLFNYECREFIDLLESVKALNKSNERQITFFGIDMQTPFQSLQNLLDSCVSNDNVTADSIRKLTDYYRALDNDMYNHSFNERDFAELVSLSNRIFNTLERQKAACLQTALIRKSIINYRQFLLLNNPNFSYEAKASLRDSLMAENVLREVNSGDKIVILAHNGHVQRTPNMYSKSMGFFLVQKLGFHYQCIGLTTTSGFYTAFTPEVGRVTDKNPIPGAAGETFEYLFSKIGKPIFFFKTSAVKQKIGDRTVPNKYKLLPFGLTDRPFVTGNLLDDFDYVLHIERTSGNQSFYLK